MYFSIPLIALIGLTFVAANPLDSGRSREECETECNDAYAACEYRSSDTMGIENDEEEIAWWVPVVLAVFINRIVFIF